MRLLNVKVILKKSINRIFIFARLLFVCSLFLYSCRKDELPVPKHAAGNVITSTVNLEPTYKWQIYYDLETNTVVGQNPKTLWDLGFETSTDGFHVILNTSKTMFVWNTNTSDFSSITDTAGFLENRKWDEPSGNADSTAIGDWRNTNNVYIVDRGYNELGTHQGFRKIQFQMVDDAKYSLRFAQLNEAGDTTLLITKDSTYNFMFLSFATSGTLVVEPPKATWDLEFTSYTHIFYNPTQPYLVTGCLLNRYSTRAVMDSVKVFSEIAYNDVSGYSLSDNINTIGYEWKTFNSGTYTTNPDLNYIILTQEGFYYKLHFIDFYNQNGLKGNPQWEYQKL